MASPDGSDGAPKGEDLQPSSSSSSSRDSSTTMGNYRSTEPTSLTIRILQEITDNFCEKRALGQGAYGKVYKGVHDNGEEIAVKLLHNNMQATNDEQFQHEFDNLMMLNHPNIVQLVGYCYETQRQHVDFQGKIVFGETTYRALCFEYMHMGSLQRHLSDELHGLDWKTRYKIIKGACEGLKYLHEGFKEPIYHLDLKPDNILLDENMTPKLADFGLSKLFGGEQTRVTNSPAGTLGYMPPEYLFRNVVSKKLDVFSLGVVITKMIAGPKGPTRSDEMPYQEFLDQVHENWRNRLEATCTSSRILEAYCEQVSICTEIGLRSMEIDRHKRPSIVDVVDRLNETETMVEKAISWPASSRSSTPVKPQREKDDNLVKVEAFARNKIIQGAETCDQFPVLVQVTASPWHRAEEMSCPCAGVDVVLVLNVRMHEVKDAVMTSVNRLRPKDRLSILFVGQHHMQHIMELTYMSSHGRDVARLKISELAHSYIHEKQEYMGPALPEAAQILRQRGVEESSSRTGSIMHMWTGPMHPEIDKQEISHEFPVHTVALGSHESRDMKHIADLTSGTYYFIEDQDLDKIEFALVSFISTITSVAARSVRITLQADEGVTISSITSGRYSNVVSSDKQTGTIDIHNICAGQQKNFIVYLTVPEGKEKLVTVGGRYQSLNMRKELVGMDVVVLRPRRKCLPNEVIIHPKVAAELLRICLMEGIAKQNNDVNGNSLRLLLDEIKNSHKDNTATEEILTDLEEEVAEMTDQYGVDREYMLSWLNCRQLQRAATKGTPPNICAFQILEQQRVDERISLLKIKGFTRSKAIMARETCNEFPVLVRVTVEPWPHSREMPRGGLDVVVILDISRNMQGERLDLVKQAMMLVIDKLSPDDRLSIVLVQTHTHRLMELRYMSDDHDHGREVARFKIIQLKASSGRYMGHIASDALQEGAQILRDRGAQESTSRLGCMMLLSDGKYPEILEIKISPEFPVHTIGLGADHNPKVMKHIADMTSGTYSFANQDTSNIKDALTLFISGLTSIAATSIQITLRAHTGIAIASIESGNYIHHVKSDKKSGTINIEHVYAGEQKDFIINLIVGSARKQLMTIGGQYKSFKCNNSLAEMDMSLLRPWFTSSADDLAINPDVATELTRIRLQNGVLDMVETHKMTTQGLQQLWNMIKQSDEGRGAPEQTLCALSMDVAEMIRDISGMSYTLSWLSCHRWQRATTKGTPKNSSAFQTIGQHAHQDANTVKVETFTRSKAIPSDDPCNNFPVLVRVMVEPRHAEEMPCAGVDVVAVLDASGGMQGEKLERLKEAVMVVIDKLRAEDRLSIVSFNTYANRLTRLTYMTDHGRDIARLKINKLVAGGRGDITAALREGAEILWWREPESSCRVGCILFLSDCENYEIFEAEIRPEFPVHTFGLGIDHNPKVMKYIADMTSGTYSFVNQAISRIKDAFVLFITSLTSVAVMSIKINLTTNEGITISSIESGGYVNNVKSNDRSGTIYIHDIYTSEWKDFIVYLRVGEGKKELMTIGGQYLSYNTVKHLANTDVHVLRPHHDCVQGELTIHRDVAARLVHIRLEEGISTMLEQGPSRIRLQQLWDGIIHSEEGRGAPEDTLSALSVDVTEMMRDIENPKEYRKSGMPYTLSWLSSHKWQRATVKGTR